MSKRPYMHNQKNSQKVNHLKSESQKVFRTVNEASTKSELTPSAKLMRKGFGIITIILTIIGFTFSSSVTQEEATEEIANRTSTIIESGFVLEDTSELALDGQDFSIGDFDGGTARMFIWDFTGDSEDKIQILVDGQVIRESHTLTSNVAAYHVPVPSVVTIRGLDGQAHYAVRFPERKYTLFNTVSPGGVNAYTLTPSVLP